MNVAASAILCRRLRVLQVRRESGQVEAEHGDAGSPPSEVTTIETLGSASSKKVRVTGIARARRRRR
jgi:hypothetical protein